MQDNPVLWEREKKATLQLYMWRQRSAPYFENVGIYEKINMYPDLALFNTNIFAHKWGGFWFDTETKGKRSLPQSPLSMSLN